jgi:hypothetical protein
MAAMDPQAMEGTVAVLSAGHRRSGWSECRRGAGREGRSRRAGADPSAAAVALRGSSEFEARCAGGRREEGRWRKEKKLQYSDCKH